MLLAIADEQATGVGRIAIESMNGEVASTVARASRGASSLVLVRYADRCCLQKLVAGTIPDQSPAIQVNAVQIWFSIDTEASQHQRTIQIDGAITAYGQVGQLTETR